MNKNDKFHFVTMDNIEEKEQEKEKSSSFNASTDEIHQAEEEINSVKEEPINVKEEPINPEIEQKEDNQEEEISKPAEVEEKTNTIPEEETVSKKSYFSYETRVRLAIFSILVLFAAATVLSIKIYRDKKGTKITYNESGSIVYSVCTKENVSFGSKCMDAGDIYKTVNVKEVQSFFKYQATFSDKVQYKMNYYVKASLKIFDTDNREEIVYKTEDILYNSSDEEAIDNNISVDAFVKINFENYYNVVEDYKKNHSSDSVDGELEVFFYIDDKDGARKISSLTIPLSLDSFRITSSELPNTEGTRNDAGEFWTTKTTIELSIAVLLLIVCIILTCELINFIKRATSKKNYYNEKLLKILREYDRIIVIARGGYESNYVREVVKVDSFDDLLKYKQELQKPIIYSRVNDVKSEFIVEGEKSIYKYVMKEADM